MNCVFDQLITDISLVLSDGYENDFFMRTFRQFVQTKWIFYSMEFYIYAHNQQIQLTFVFWRWNMAEKLSIATLRLNHTEKNRNTLQLFQ